MDITNIMICEVISLDDENKSDRIKVRVPSFDDDKDIKDIQYAYPLLPKLLHVKPKLGESVIIFLTKGNDAFSNRFYIGPIISQMQDMENDKHYGSALTMFPGSMSSPKVAYDLYPETNGAFAKDEDVAIYGRKNTDVILGENNVDIRCGARVMQENKNAGVVFNRTNPSYLKLTYSPDERVVEDKFSGNKHSYGSTANLVADKINLISNNGPTPLNVTNPDGMVDYNDLDNIIKEAHSVPYGDVLVKFLKVFLEMFKRHAHPFPGESTILPQDDPNSKNFFNYDFDSMLSDNIKIN